MKLKYDFVINNVAGQKVAMPIVESNENYGNFIKLNETGAYIMEKLKNDITVEEIVTAIKNDFEVSPEQDIEKMVLSFIDKLREADVLE